MAKGGYVYIISNRYRTVLYIGVISNLYNRAYEHKTGEGSYFTKKYNCTYLIYHEYFDTIEASKREKQLKKWKRSWKEELIRKANPAMKDLSQEVADMQ